MFLDATKKLANKIRQTLKIQQGKNEKSQEQDTTKLSARQQTDLRLRLTQVASQSKRFQEVWSEYNDSQLNFRKKTKANLVKQIKVTGQTDLSNDEIEQMIGTVSNVLDFIAKLLLSQVNWGSFAGSVIQDTRTVKFEDGLRTGVLPGGCWYPCGDCI